MHAENAAGRIAAPNRTYTAEETRFIYVRPQFYDWPLQLLLYEVPFPTIRAERLGWEQEDEIRVAGGDPFIPVVAAAYPGFTVIAAEYADRDEAASYQLVAEG